MSFFAEMMLLVACVVRCWWQYWDIVCGREQYVDSSTPLLDTAEQVTEMQYFNNCI
jgi:hypothetical protein